MGMITRLQIFSKTGVGGGGRVGPGRALSILPAHLPRESQRPRAGCPGLRCGLAGPSLLWPKSLQLWLVPWPGLSSPGPGSQAGAFCQSAACQWQKKAFAEASSKIL